MTRLFRPGTESAAGGDAAVPSSAVIYDLWGPDIRAIQRMEVVPRILKTVCDLTGMGFATVGRVTDESWICCASHDEIGFGMKPGTLLDLDSTLCKTICRTGQPVVIDEVAADAEFADHPVPKLFHFQSNLSVPIFRPDGSIFGTLCAIDPKPRVVSNPAIVETCRLFADLIGAKLGLVRASEAPGPTAPDGG